MREGFSARHIHRRDFFAERFDERELDAGHVVEAGDELRLDVRAIDGARGAREKLRRIDGADRCDEALDFVRCAGIEIGRGFVQEENLRIERPGSRQRDALLFATRENARRVSGKPFESGSAQRVARSRFALRPGHARQRQRVFHVGELPRSGTSYFVMQYVAGKTLHETYPPGSRLAQGRGKRVVGEIAAALAAAHERGASALHTRG